MDRKILNKMLLKNALSKRWRAKNYDKKKDVLFTPFECKCLNIKLYKNINLYKIAMVQL